MCVCVCVLIVLSVRRSGRERWRERGREQAKGVCGCGDCSKLRHCYNKIMAFIHSLSALSHATTVETHSQTPTPTSTRPPHSLGSAHSSINSLKSLKLACTCRVIQYAQVLFTLLLLLLLLRLPHAFCFFFRFYMPCHFAQPLLSAPPPS